MYEDVANFNDYDDAYEVTSDSVFVYDSDRGVALPSGGGETSPKWFQSTTDTTEYDEVTETCFFGTLVQQLTKLFANEAVSLPGGVTGPGC